MKAESSIIPVDMSVDYVRGGRVRLNCCFNITQITTPDDTGTEITKYIYDHAAIKWALPSPEYISTDTNNIQHLTDAGYNYLESIKNEIMQFAAATV